MKSLLFLCIIFLASSASAGVLEDIKSLQPGNWYEIPNSALESVKYDWSPNNAPGNGFSYIMKAWSGGVYNTTDKQLIVHGGGHGGYGGNEIYGFNMDTASNSFSWEMIESPSSYATIKASDGKDRYYSDGLPGSIHTYRCLAYDSTNNKMWSMGGVAVYPQANGFNEVVSYDFDTNEWSEDGDYADTPGDSRGHCSAQYDPVTDTIWYFQQQFYRAWVTYTSDTHTLRGSQFGSTWFYGANGLLDPDEDTAILVGKGYYRKWDKSSYDVLSTSSSGPQDVVNAASEGTMAYDTVADKFVSWMGGKDVYVLDAVNDVWSIQTGDAGSDTPPAYTPAGVNGRWQYVPSLNVFVVATDTDENVWVYKHYPDNLDQTSPSISIFLLSETSNSKNIPILSFTATDNIGVNGYIITEASSMPTLNDPKWSRVAPVTYTVTNNGSHTLFAWAKDISGNISNSRSAVVEVSADFESPIVTSFDLPASSTDLSLNIQSFSATDDTAVTGYLVNESTNIPSPGDAGWLDSPPSAYTASGGGVIEIFAWAKDREGNISVGRSDTVDISLHYTPGALLVGPYQQYKTVSEAISNANDNDIIEIDAGIYEGDVALISQNNLTIRGIGGRAHLKANGASVQGKGIWVIQGSNVTIENIEFSGATVSDQNGAGIRSEGVGLTVRNCYFHDNENGILGGHWDSDILIEHCEFSYNGYGDGQSHNLYIGKAKTLTFRYNYSHHAIVGQNLKSRAVVNYILYNRLMDEQTGYSSYIIDLSNGGTSYVIGNLLQQGTQSENWSMLTYGPEGLTHPGKDLYVVNNTFVNDRGNGRFLNLNDAATAKVINNIFVGVGEVLVGNGEMITNLVNNNPGLIDAANFDYRLNDSSPALNGGSEPGTVNGFNLMPVSQYLHQTSYYTRTNVGQIDIGAYEFGNNPPQVGTPQSPINLRIVEN